MREKLAGEVKVKELNRKVRAGERLHDQETLCDGNLQATHHEPDVVRLANYRTQQLSADDPRRPVVARLAVAYVTTDNPAKVFALPGFLHDRTQGPTLGRNLVQLAPAAMGKERSKTLARS